MNSLNSRAVDMLGRVVEFGSAYKPRFSVPEIERFDIVSVACEHIRLQTASQTSSVSAIRESASVKALERAALREDMTAIVRTAGALAVTIKGLEKKFRMPRSGGDAALLNTARAFLADAATFEKAFIEYRLPADFLNALRKRIEALEKAVHNHSVGKRTRVSATASIDNTLEQGFTALQQLDGIVPNVAANDPVMKAAWASARHVARAAVRSKAAAAQAAAAPA